MSRRCISLIVCLVLTGCLATTKEDRIKIIEERDLEVRQETAEEGSRSKAIESYRDFLDKEQTDPLRAEAMRRLADLQLEKAEAEYLHKAKTLEDAAQSGQTLNPADYTKAIQTYRELLRKHPDYIGNDHVLYQLARAYEQSADYAQALQTLDGLVASYPNAKFIDEVQFRRGELFFVTALYRRAEQAYDAVLRFGESSLFYERALYKRGWSIFKQSRHELALDAFFAVLDRKLPTTNAVSEGATLTRGDRELIDDTFRVVSLSFSYLGGEKAITKYLKKEGARPYGAAVYDHLGALYLKQERYADAASVFSEFIKQGANDRRAPQFQLKIIETYKQGGFPTLLLKAKEELVVAYGVNSKFWSLHDESTRVALTPHLKSNIEDLAHHFHAQAQKTRKAGDYEHAARWYSEFVQAFSSDAGAAKMNFLLAETLFAAGRYADAATQYETTAYRYPLHADSAEAGYAALLAHKKREEELRERDKAEYQRHAIASALHFGDAFPRDHRVATVLTKAAEDLFALNEPERAAAAARRVVAVRPQPQAPLRRTAWTVIAHTEFDRQAYEQAEAAYQAVLRLTAAEDPQRPALIERLASSVYKQGEYRRSAGDLRAAVTHFLRVKELAPASSVTPTAEYDAAAGLIALKDWRGAVNVLEGFRTRFAHHPLQREVPEKLAAAYLEGQQWSRAAAAFEEIADRREDEKFKQEALWQAAELYERDAQPQSAVAVYKRYIGMFPRSFERSIEARHRIAQFYEARTQNREYYYWLEQVAAAADAGGQQWTARTQYLAAKAVFILAERAFQEFRAVRLAIPLERSLKEKKQKMQVALKAYARAADYGVAEFTTAATFRIAEIYHGLSRDLLASERPQGLTAQEREQYNVLLEEQAYPFEEKAIEIHETNVRRVAGDVYDEWVRKSFEQLRKLRPVQYAKFEKSEAVSNAIQ